MHVGGYLNYLRRAKTIAWPLGGWMSHTGPLLSTMSLHVCGACQCARQLDTLHIRGQKCWNVLKIVSPCFSMVLPCCSVPSLLKVRAPNEVYWTNADRLAKPLLTWFNGTTSPGQTPHWDSYPRMNSDGSHVSCRNGEPVGLPWDTLWDSKLGWSPEPFSNPACCRQVLESFQSVQQNVWDTGIPMTWCKVVLFVMQQVFANSLPAAKAAGHRSRWEKTEAIVQDEEKKEGLHSFEQGGCPCILPGQHRILDGRIHSLQRWCVIPT
jgi:hypothetical protein